MPDPYIAELLDEACTEMDATGRLGAGFPAEIRVSNRAYDTIVAAKAEELARGLPLLLLGLKLVATERVAENEVELTWLPRVPVDNGSRG